VDPDSELIDEVVVTPANTPDRDAVDDLLAEHQDVGDKPTVVGDSAYAHGATREHLEDNGHEVLAKTPPARNSTGGFPKDRFVVDPDAGTVTCPAQHSVVIRPARGGGGKASFAAHCADCPLRNDCTTSRRGRTVTVHPQEAILQRARAEQTRTEWKTRYRADRPVVERKIAHLMRRAWGGRRARTRGRVRVATDIDTRAGAINLARLAILGLGHDHDGWTIRTT
jgi:Transposase DDE domain